MKAIMIHAPHDLRVEDFPRPVVDAGPGDVTVRVAAGGICGSDLHYFNHGGFGAIRLQEPMALGHEASGFVEAVGADVAGIRVGDLVAINPSKPCGTCRHCRSGVRTHCSDMRFNGSAMRMPHEQGLFRERFTVEAARAVVMPAGTPASVAALCEPFAVGLHAVREAGDLRGKTVLVSGCGPIGILTIVAARLAGAARILATDLTRHCLAMAARMGATDCHDVSEGLAGLAVFAEDKGRVDVVWECSGSPRAMAGALTLLRPRGRMILVGLGGEIPVPVNAIVTKEIQISGSFRFDGEFAEAARLIGRGLVDLTPIISATYPMSEAQAAFEHAGDRSRATKIVIALSDKVPA